VGRRDIPDEFAFEEGQSFRAKYMKPIQPFAFTEPVVYVDVRLWLQQEVNS
jgi:hypothetical protein